MVPAGDDQHPPAASFGTGQIASHVGRHGLVPQGLHPQKTRLAAAPVGVSPIDRLHQRLLVGIGHVQLRNPGSLRLIELRQVVTGHRFHLFPGGIETDDGDPVLPAEVKQRLVIVEIHAPDLVPSALLQQLFLRKFTGDPFVEYGLLLRSQHLHSQRHFARVAFRERLQQSQLQPVGGRIVVGLTHIDDPRIGSRIEHLCLGHEDAGGNVQDLPHLRRPGGRIGHLRIPQGRSGTAREHQRTCQDKGPGFLEYHHLLYNQAACHARTHPLI